MEVREVEGVELLDHVTKGLIRLFIGAVEEIVEGAEANADPISAYGVDDGLDYLQAEARAVLDGPAVRVRTLVGRTLEELVDQVAVGSVDFDAVEPGFNRVLGGLCEIRNKTLDLLDSQGAGSGVVDGTLGSVHLVILTGADGDSGGSDGVNVAGLVLGMGGTTHVPNLAVDVGALLVDGLGDRLPGFDLLGGENAGGAGVAEAGVSNGSGLSNQKRARNSPLSIILSGNGLGNIV
mmetsp:Transcript_2295/g.3483  ORF Transcript_2295/g.3483 Transcript_2295/m.3483 type:complete len:236 (+) Transcript_2295:763-1470(+)